MGKIFFISDLHLGATALKNNKEREEHIVKWLHSIKEECNTLYLLGDVFDFWFEYKHTVPKGYVRFLSTLCEFTDAGIEVHLFIGNHDIWAFDYLTKECGVIIHTAPEELVINNKRFLIGHGDGLNPQDKGYLLLNAMFKSRFLQFCFRWLHPDLGIALANKWSSHSRLSDGKIEADAQRTADKEEIVQYCLRTLQNQHYDYFIFGHRHWPAYIELQPNVFYLNTGDWITHFTYGVFDGETLSLKNATL
ncbi:MAG: UDP-2,3-diacylglucosamine diphosphatase [Marinifilaceae bacterium]